MPKPSKVTVDIDDSSDFEEINHPQAGPSLPLHYMGEDKARRRTAGRPLAGQTSAQYVDVYDDDDGKDVYQKMRGGPGPSSQIMYPRRSSHPQPPPTNITELLEQNMEHIIPAVYTILSCWTRFYQIGKSNTVVWDEAHFGKFGSHYLKREFYFDVHPPLGKMLVGLAGALSGYDGSFEFKSGEEYPENLPYVAMRVLLAIPGVLMVPLGWYTAREIGMGWRASHLVAIMCLFELAWLCISRFILLDSMLLFFTLTTVFCLTKFHNEQYDPFSIDWWLWLVMTGLSIGCVTSVKWIGAFVTALVGLYTIEDLWDKFGDLRMSYRDQIWHWGSRVACLIVLPVLVYMTSFKIHFWVLNHSGPGDAQMSSLFQAHLKGNDFYQNPLDVAFGSKVSLKNMGWGGGLLHSHAHVYPEGSGQQQVTCYHYKDDNNHWVVLPTWEEPSPDPNGDLRFLKNGDVIRLQHVPTTRNLHSHSVAAPITKLNNEVACYGNSTIGDFNDYWIVEVVDDIMKGKTVDRIHSLTTRLRFKHKTLNCYLRAANAILPQWAWKQIEVSCDKENNPGDAHTYWNVESHWNDRLPAGEAKLYKSPFLRDFWHLNIAMMTSNNALIPDPDKEDVLASKPLDWPLMHLGLRMCGWADHQVKYYLLGNPIIYWTGALSLLLFPTTLGIYILRTQRKYIDMDPVEWAQFLHGGKIALVGWMLHFLPFLIMGRVTYVHHYLPALYFAVLMNGHLLDQFIFKSKRLTERSKWVVFGVFAFAVFATFWWFKGIAFGIEGPVNDHKGLWWRSSWNIYNA